MKSFNILVFPGGTEIGLEIWNSLKNCKEVLLHSVSSQVPNHASYVYKRHHVIPDIFSPGWIDALNAVIIRNNIDFIFPAHSGIIDSLISFREVLKAPSILPESNVCEILRSKTRTYEMFNKLIPTPRLYHSIHDVGAFPIFVKPDNGHGSQGAQIVQDAGHLQGLLRSNSGLIMMEYLPGKEFTVDCFSVKGKGLLFSSGRERTRIRMGTSMNSVLVADFLNNHFRNIAEIITSVLPLEGPWFFQMKEDSKGKLTLLEIEPRIAGTMALNRVRGINFALLAILAKAGMDVELMLNQYDLEIDRCLTSRYRHKIIFDTVYVDLDDTILHRDRINTQMMRFLFQEINKGSRIILISKSQADDKEYLLRNHRISELFDETIWLKEGDSKADYIKPKRAIFIDDSFSQRKEVYLRHRIPTFDSSMVELLIDERE